MKFRCLSLVSTVTLPLLSLLCLDLGQSFLPSKTTSRLHQNPASQQSSPLGRYVRVEVSKEICPELDCEDSMGLEFSLDSLNESESISILCNLLGGQPQDLLRCATQDSGVRGVFANKDIKEGDKILSLPLESCLLDDEPPAWLKSSRDEMSSSVYNPSDWATRLAATLVEMQFQKKQGSIEADGYALWLSMLPDSEILRASLPVHWPEETVQSARSTALEIAVDSAFFARAEAVEDLVSSIKSSNIFQKESGDGDFRKICNNALDIVQTRSCRVIRDDRPLRVLAPIFDLLNHGKGAKANSDFGLESGDVLVVRARRDISADEEILIDYGGSAQPAWRCLLSYGFAPLYESSDGVEGEDDEEVAEVYMDGVRYEVGPSHLPFEMVAAAATCVQDKVLSEDEVALTPAVAQKIADRITEVAYYLLLEPETEKFDDDSDDFDSTTSPFDVVSNQQAAALRWSQHRVLLSCANGLKDFSEEEESLQ